MDLFILYIIIPFVVIAFIRSLLGRSESPRIVYTSAESPASRSDPDGTGCLTPMVLGAIILGILWLAA